MTTQATLGGETNACGQVLYMVLELSSRTWKVLFRSSAGRQRQLAVAARDVAGLMREVAEAKRKLGLPEEARVVCCYEAGRDGFWLHRALAASGIESLVVDSSSIEVPRRARHKKTDRLDLTKLMSLLVRYLGGERGVWSVVRVPDKAVEDVRQLARSIERLKSERGQHRTRIKSLLCKEGLAENRIGGSDWCERVGKLRRWDGSPLPPHLARDLLAEGERLSLVERQLAELKAEREALVASSPCQIAGKARALRQLGAIAEESSFVFSAEMLGWRTFANRREVAGAVGITGTPYTSGESEREQGISKAGNRRMRAMLVEIAWGWLKYQPASALSRWWQRRFAKGNKRTRRIGIVALARKLVIALWRYLEEGLVPEGAHLKALKRRRAVARTWA
jgi:transposase